MTTILVTDRPVLSTSEGLVKLVWTWCVCGTPVTPGLALCTACVYSALTTKGAVS